VRTEHQGRAGQAGTFSDADLVERSRQDPACCAMIFEEQIG